MSIYDICQVVLFNSITLRQNFDFRVKISVFFQLSPIREFEFLRSKKSFISKKKLKLKLVGHKIKFCRSVINGKSSTSFPISKQKRKWSNLVDCMSLLIFWQLFIFKWIYKLDYQIVIINKTKEQSRKCYLALCKLVATRLLLLLSEKKKNSQGFQLWPFAAISRRKSYEWTSWKWLAKEKPRNCLKNGFQWHP